jgi:hypothetical protein
MPSSDGYSTRIAGCPALISIMRDQDYPQWISANMNFLMDAEFSGGIFDGISANRFRPFWVMRWRKAIQAMDHGLYVAPMRQNFFLPHFCRFHP